MDLTSKFYPSRQLLIASSRHLNLSSGSRSNFRIDLLSQSCEVTYLITLLTGNAWQSLAETRPLAPHEPRVWSHVAIISIPNKL
jgi:hypothetical protein